MTRLLLNGSPRGKNSNSRLILSWLTQGMAKAGVAEPPVLDLARISDLESQRAAFLAADEVVLVFPLYTDSMPGLVKAFLEAVGTAEPAQLKGKRIAFVVQSGFPESIHSEAVARYLARVSSRLGWVHAGTLIKGGVEGIRVMPAWQVARTKAAFIRAGRELGRDGSFSDELRARLAGPRTFGPWQLRALRVVMRTGLLNFYWNSMLKKHNAHARRFDAPYGSAARR
ncbi:NAD(P)H-dependent oxidoreductase [Myxococcota bacterium]|nr:NAD(P)H-dependent oxidoreductase [Myxococcota bacterium]